MFVDLRICIWKVTPLLEGSIFHLNRPGLNYRSHAAETGKDLPRFPVFAFKNPVFWRKIWAKVCCKHRFLWGQKGWKVIYHHAVRFFSKRILCEKRSKKYSFKNCVENTFGDFNLKNWSKLCVFFGWFPSLNMTQGFSVSWLRKGGGISFCCQIGMFRFDLQKWMCDSSNAWASKKLNLLVFFVKDEACPICFVWRSFKWRIVSPFSRNLFKVVRIGPNDTIFIPKAIAGGVSWGLMDWCVGEMVKSDFTQTCWIFLYFFGWFRLFSESQRQLVFSLCHVCETPYFFGGGTGKARGVELGCGSDNGDTPSAICVFWKDFGFEQVVDE